MPTGIYKHNKLSEKARKKLSEANKRNGSYYNQILARELKKKGKEGTSAEINRLKVRSAWLANR